MKGFGKGLIAGAGAAAVLSGLMWFFYIRDKEVSGYEDAERELEDLREDYGGRDPYEFLDSVPGVRGAVDDANAEFRRRRDEAVQRTRSGIAD